MMCGRLTHLTCFVVVLSLALASPVSAELVAHWKLDDGSGTTALDSSGNGNDGTLNGGATWVDGQFGSAIQFNGSDSYVAASHIPFDNRNFTVTLWANPALGGDQNVFSQDGGGDSGRMHLRITGGGTVRMGYWNNDLDSPTALQANNWYFLTFVHDVENANRRIYIDGVQDAEDSGGAFIGTSGDTIIGSQFGTGQWFMGIIDDVRIYSRALSDVEILGVMAGSGAEYPLASGPSPADGALLMDTWVNLGWRAGNFAVSHDVYLADNFDDVNDGTPEAFRGNQPLTSTTSIAGFAGFPYPDGLVPGTTYYWRIDEVNDLDPNSPWKGPVWSFWIPPYTAYDPHPPDGAEFVDLNVEFNWTAGFRAKMHNVYFGDDFDDVNNAIVGIPQPATTYTPGTLELEKTYYWRVDEFDGAVMHKGDILSFTTRPHIPIADPSLIGWWKLDGVASSATAVDWSGYNHHGTVMGDPEWMIGYDGDALELDGDGDYVDVGSVGISGTDPRTITGWVKASTTDIPSWTTVFGFAHDGSGDGTYFDIGVDNAGNYGIHILGWGSVIRAVDTRWHYFAATYDGSEGLWYVDGQFVDSLAGAIATTDEVRIGARLSNNNYFPGLVDDIRIYNKALTQNEIREVMRGDPELAFDPGPGNGSIVDVIEATSLSWLPGEKAAQHDVYFGTDKDAVADADISDATGKYRGRQGVTVYTPPEGVEWGGGSYYWRIDEYNTDATISKGNIWAFTVADNLIVDDFEDYNNYPPDEIWNTWVDGFQIPMNGAQVGYGDDVVQAGGDYTETTIVHGGAQSMPLFFDNNLITSEATMTLAPSSDWTREGVTKLILWFRGDSGNTADRLFVALNGTAVVYHGDPAATQITGWNEWVIDLATFGVDLTNVDSITIGVGTKNSPTAGGPGTMYFDDIRLYR